MFLFLESGDNIEDSKQNNYTDLLIELHPEKNSITFLYKKHEHLKKLMIVDGDALVSIVRKYLNSGYLRVLQSYDDFVYVRNSNGITLEIKNENNSLSFLLEEIRKKYFQDRTMYFFKALKKIWTINLIFRPDSKRSDFAVWGEEDNKIEICYGFFSEGSYLIDIEQEFLEKVLQSLLNLNNRALSCTEYFHWDEFGKASSVSCYSLKKGNIFINYDIHLKSYIDREILKYRENTGQKLYRVLKGGEL